jgi:MFS family permease
MQYKVLMPAYARKDLGLDAKGLGALMSAAGIGALLGASIVATAGGKIRSSTVIICGMFVMPLGLWGATASHSLHFSMFCIAVIGLGMMSFMAVSNSIILMDAPEDMKGRIMAIRTLVFMGLSPLMGSMLLGWIAQSYSVSVAMRLGAIACAVAAVGLLIRSHKLFRTEEDKPA